MEDVKLCDGMKLILDGVNAWGSKLPWLLCPEGKFGPFDLMPSGRRAREIVLDGIFSGDIRVESFPEEAEELVCEFVGLLAPRMRCPETEADPTTIH